MKSFNPRHYRKNRGVYILSYDDISDITKGVLLDYDNTYLSEPKKLDMEDFALNYLGASEVDFHYIWTENKAEQILGATTFEKCRIKMFDKDNEEIYFQDYDEHAIILSKELIDGKRTSQYGITGFHECGHLYMHKEYYSVMDGQIPLEIDCEKRLCNRSHIEMYKNKKIITPQDWIEWQATIFAVTITLNEDSVAIAMNDILKQVGINKGFVIEDDYSNYNLVNNVILNKLSNIYGISKEAIRYRLRKLGYFKTKAEYANEKMQMTIFDL